MLLKLLYTANKLSNSSVTCCNKNKSLKHFISITNYNNANSFNSSLLKTSFCNNKILFDTYKKFKDSSQKLLYTASANIDAYESIEASNLFEICIGKELNNINIDSESTIYSIAEEGITRLLPSNKSSYSKFFRSHKQLFIDWNRALFKYKEPEAKNSSDYELKSLRFDLKRIEFEFFSKLFLSAAEKVKSDAEEFKNVALESMNDAEKSMNDAEKLKNDAEKVKPAYIMRPPDFEFHKFDHLYEYLKKCFDFKKITFKNNLSEFNMLPLLAREDNCFQIQFDIDMEYKVLVLFANLANRKTDLVTTRNSLCALAALSGAGKSTFLDYVPILLRKVKSFSKKQLEEYFNSVPFEDLTLKTEFGIFLIEKLRMHLLDHPLIVIPITFNKYTNLVDSKEMDPISEIAVRMLFTMFAGNSSNVPSQFDKFISSIDPEVQKSITLYTALKVIIYHNNILIGNPSKPSIKTELRIQSPFKPPIVFFLVDELSKFLEMKLHERPIGLYRSAISVIGALSDHNPAEFQCISVFTTLDFNLTQESLSASGRVIEWIGLNYLNYNTLRVRRGNCDELFVDLIEKKIIGGKIPSALHYVILNSFAGHSLAIKYYYDFLDQVVSQNEFEWSEIDSFVDLMNKFRVYAVEGVPRLYYLLLMDINYELLKPALLCNEIKKNSQFAKYYFNSSFSGDVSGDFVPKFSQFLLFCYAYRRSNYLETLLYNILAMNVSISKFVSGAVVEHFVASLLNIRRYLLTDAYKGSKSCIISLSDYIGEYETNIMPTSIKIKLYAPDFKLPADHDVLKSKSYSDVNKSTPITWIGGNHKGFDLFEKMEVLNTYTILINDIKGQSEFKVIPGIFLSAYEVKAGSSLCSEKSSKFVSKLKYTSNILTKYYKGKDKSIPSNLLILYTMKSVSANFITKLTAAVEYGQPFMYVVVKRNTFYKIASPFSSNWTIKDQIEYWDN